MTYTVTNQWSGGFQADVRLTNTGTSAWNGWSLDWSFPGDQKVTQMWNAEHTQSGTSVTARNVGWNAGVAPGASVDFGFTGSWSGTNAEPEGFAVAGRACPTAT